MDYALLTTLQLIWMGFSLLVISVYLSRKYLNTPGKGVPDALLFEGFVMFTVSGFWFIFMPALLVMLVPVITYITMRWIFQGKRRYYETSKVYPRL